MAYNWRGYQDQDIKRNAESIKAKPGPEVAVIGLSLAPQPVRAGALRDCTSTYCRIAGTPQEDCTSTYCRIASTPQAHTAGWQAHLKNPAAKKTRTTTPPTDLASKIKDTTNKVPLSQLSADIIYGPTLCCFTHSDEVGASKQSFVHGINYGT